MLRIRPELARLRGCRSTNQNQDQPQYETKCNKLLGVGCNVNGQQSFQRWLQQVEVQGVGSI